jgi:hypothetical protein
MYYPPKNRPEIRKKKAKLAKTMRNSQKQCKMGEWLSVAVRCFAGVFPQVCYKNPFSRQ